VWRWRQEVCLAGGASAASKHSCVEVFHRAEESPGIARKKVREGWANKPPSQGHRLGQEKLKKAGLLALLMSTGPVMAQAETIFGVINGRYADMAELDSGAAYYPRAPVAR
jgi:hypothetical protein